MADLMEYRGYGGSVGFSPEDQVFCGRVQGIRDLVSYEAPDVEGLESAFRESVDDYLASTPA